MRIYAVTIRSINKTYVVASHSVRGAINRAVFQSCLTDVKGLRMNYKVRYADDQQIEQFKKDYPFANIELQ